MEIWGWRLIIIGTLSFLIPVFGRQFSVVTLIDLSGMGTIVAGLIFISAGAGLILLEKYKNTEIPPKITKPLFKYIFPIGAGVGILFSTAQIIYSDIQSSKTKKLAETISTNYTPNPCGQDSQTCLSKIIPTERNIENGTAKYFAAINWSDGSVHLYVSLTGATSSPIADHSLGKALLLIRKSLCAPSGLLHQAGVTEKLITLILYEKDERLGEYPLPTGYCTPVQ